MMDASGFVAVDRPQLRMSALCGGLGLLPRGYLKTGC